MLADFVFDLFLFSFPFFLPLAFWERNSCPNLFSCACFKVRFHWTYELAVARVLVSLLKTRLTETRATTTSHVNTIIRFF